jgi:glycosyltransferase involved in cell wall biosynthesis
MAGSRHVRCRSDARGVARVRLAFVHTVAQRGGAERYTADLATGLALRGHEIHAFVSPSGGLAKALGGSAVCIHPLSLGLAVGWHGAIGSLSHPLNWADLYANPLRGRVRTALEALASRGPVDVVHAQAVKEKLWVTSFARRRGIVSAWTVHAPLEPWMREGAPGRVHEWARGNLDGLIAVNGAALDDYAAFGIRPCSAAVIHNGLDISAYSNGDRGPTRSRLGLAQDDVAVLMPARPYVGKGVGVLMDALAIVGSDAATRDIPLRTFVAGGSRHVEAYRVQAASKGLGDRIVFLGHRDDIPDLLAAADIVTLPSFYEGLPYAISEAMAASLPVIATRVGGIPEMIEDPGSGLLIDRGDAPALAACLMRLAGEPGLRRAMGERARRLAEQRFSLDRMLDESEAFFASLAEKSVCGGAP